MLPKIAAMESRLVRDVFDHPDYIFELNHHGFRGLAYRTANAPGFTALSRPENFHRSRRRSPNSPLTRTLPLPTNPNVSGAACLGKTKQRNGRIVDFLRSDGYWEDPAGINFTFRLAWDFSSTVRETPKSLYIFRKSESK